jgi:lipoprotein-releasing system permease protein
MSVMNGFRAELFQRDLGLNGHMNVFALQGPLPNFDEIAARVRGIEGVERVTPSIEGQGLITGRGSPRGVLLRGIRPEDIRTKPILSDHVVLGSLDSFGGNTVAIGSRLSVSLGVTVGDTVTLISPQGRSTVFGSTPRFASYTIGAIYDVGMYEYDSGYIFMPLESAQAFYQMPVSVSALEIFAKDAHNLDSLKQAIMDSEPVRVLDWKEQNASFTNALQVERNVMFLILSLIIMVAAFNIISSLIMLVKDKGRDIAILRTMGATRGMIQRIFFLTGASIGVLGTLLGLALGVAFAENIETIRQWLQKLTDTELFNAEIYFLSQLPAIVDYGEVAQVVGMALFLSFAATIYPSRRAAKLDPVEALRHE